MPPAAGERRAPARPGRNSPHLQKSGLRGSFSLSVPELGAGGAGVPGCYGRSGVPGVDLSCTWRGRAMYPGALFRQCWPRPAAARARRLAVGLRSHSPPCTARTRGPGHLRLGPGRGSGSCRGYGAGGPGPAEDRPAAGAVCSRGTAARGMCRGAGDGSTGTGKTWQRRGTGSPGISQPAPGSPGSRRDCPELTRAASGRVAGAGTGDGPQSGQTVQPDSRTDARSAPLANTGTDTYSV